MSLTVKSLSAKAMSLPPSQRSELIDILVESLGDPPKDEIQEAWKVEAQKRLSDVREGKVEVVPGMQVMAKARKLVQP